MDDNTIIMNSSKPQMIVKIMKPHQNKPVIEPIKIIEPFKSDVLLFENPDDFTEYYRTHEEEFKGVSTVLLNRKYKIPGYRITQTKTTKELSLRKDYYGQGKTTSDDNTELLNRIAKLENDVIELSKEINNIIKYLQSETD